jgi:hypothetical protein
MNDPHRHGGDVEPDPQLRTIGLPVPHWQVSFKLSSAEEVGG